MGNGLRPLWNAILDVYDAYANVCSEHGLRYYAAYGTVLGAVRHMGFIPWDDDFDIMMPRGDYEEFINVAAKKLPDELRLVTIFNDSVYDAPYAKVQMSSSKRLEEIEEATGRHLPHGVYIDVFPIDGCYDGKIQRKARRMISRLLVLRRRYLNVKNGYGNLGWLQRVIGKLTWCIFPRLSSSKDFALYDMHRLSCPRYGTTSRCAITNNELSLAYPFRAFPLSCLGEGILLPFEGRQIPVPADYDTYLRIYYGDYMTPPPLSKRVVSTHANLEDAHWRTGPVLDD